ncbi:hypothetical protein NNJEOMEG_02951 [Fundidesulfovibrio magnetotacticus]|uniref:Uncharacterized protein n=1 Tax=Fundidesulfovibrio magnetotacticus TaxID=2730080 RepID=A0A6V8LZN0_9BACT|nr:tetratricopeptide repeat protein [Fundidesulfovibrio magnetotacticus]GFK95097.1 hypothetical protein NNJEOMEG_02951 [Fundidesulfovibrio magnetotacticus]
MYRLSHLVDKATPVAQPKLVSSGVCVWLVWEGQITPVLNQIFTEFGGFLMGQEGSQALWYFFGEEAFKALGRLAGYSRVNRLPLFVQALPGSLLVGYKYEMSLAVQSEYLEQEVAASQDLEMYVHPGFAKTLEALPGLGFKPAPDAPGLSRAGFGLLAVDTTLGQESPLGWYYMLRPLGDPLDKNAAEGWRAIFSELQTLLERMAVKYLSHEGYLIFGLDNLRSFRNITRELLRLERDIKNPESGKKYWPSVMACVFRKGQHLHKDLPKRIGLDWKELAPDFPHMSFKAAFFLGPGFRINDVRRASSTLTVDDWCHISLASEEEAEDEQGEIPFKLPTNLMAGANIPCFYCGLASHAPASCPTKAITELHPDVWEDIGMQDMVKLEEASMRLNQDLAGSAGDALAETAEAKDLRGLILRGIFEINHHGQLRCLAAVWRSKGKEMPAGLSPTGARDDSELLWNALDRLRGSDAEGFDLVITQALTQYGRGFQPRSVQGFMAMESGDWNRTGYFWQEAARGAYTALQRGWLAYLEGRGWEVQGDYQKALSLYRQARGECPRWVEPVYRQGVCMVKLGFTDQGLHEFLVLLRDDLHLFNRILLDPELERGRIHIQSSLWRPWSEARAARDEKAASLTGLDTYLKSWFREDHPFLQEALERARVLIEMAKINNYVCFNRVVSEYDSLQNDLHQTVEEAITAINGRLKVIHEELKEIHHEAAWFPFGKLLKEFNKDFNSCATKLNWMRTTSLQVAANFRKCQDYLDEIDASVTLLKARLVTLRIVRDATLFVLLLGKSFMWLELVGLALSLVAVPGMIFLAQKTGQIWFADLMSDQKWQVQKGLVIIVSIVAMALAAIKTAVSFEKKRAELFKEEEDKAAKEKGKVQARSAKAQKALPPAGGPSAKGGK